MPDTRPVIVYGEPDENVATTVVPEVGTAVTVFEVVPASFVKEMVIDVVVVAVTVRLVGGRNDVVRLTGVADVLP